LNISVLGLIPVGDLQEKIAYRHLCPAGRAFCDHGLLVLAVAGLRKNLGPLDMVHAYLEESLSRPLESTPRRAWIRERV